MTAIPTGVRPTVILATTVLLEVFITLTAPLPVYIPSAFSLVFVTYTLLPSALAADWLVSTWDNNAALYACGPASAVVEEVAGRWIKDLLDLPASASIITTSDGLSSSTAPATSREMADRSSLDRLPRFSRKVTEAFAPRSRSMKTESVAITICTLAVLTLLMV